jgi:phosphodiesterase/alkaline phosphatase D-like protein
VVSDVQIVVRDTRATVLWRTDQPTSGAVDYAVMGAAHTSTARGETCAAALAHAVELRGLQPEARYSYRVIATDAVGVATTTESAEFITMAPFAERLYLPVMRYR